jgi:hypothetical protein
MNNNKNNEHRTTNNTELHNRENSTLQDFSYLNRFGIEILSV